MRRIVLWQYILMGAAWAAAIASWRLRAFDLNGFLGWHGTQDTEAFVRLLFQEPRSWLHEVNERPAPLHTAWLSLTIAGFIFFIFAPTMVRRRNIWRAPGRNVIRLLGVVLLIFPLALLAPLDWHLPRPLPGMYVLALAHLLMFVSLLLTPAHAPPESAFPVQPSLRSDHG